MGWGWALRAQGLSLLSLLPAPAPMPAAMLSPPCGLCPLGTINQNILFSRFPGPSDRRVANAASVGQG